MKSKFTLKDKTVLITGASRGLGRALALKISEKGARVILSARHAEELLSVETEIRKAGGIAYGLVADISDKSAIYPWVGQAAALSGPIDVLINNASTLGPLPLRPWLDTDCEDLEQTFQTNFIGPFRLTKAVLGSMLVRQQGVILNISSDAAVSAYPDWGAYSASKAALDQMTRIWGAELAETPLRIIGVDPGEMDTQMHADALPDSDPANLARPEDVADVLISIVENSKEIASGSRLIASEWSQNEVRTAG